MIGVGMEFNWVAIVVGLLGAGGIGAAVREIASVIDLARKGVSGREDRRRSDIVAQRDFAVAQQAEAEAAERAAEASADIEAAARRRWQELAARYRLQLVMGGIEPIEPWPTDATAPTT